MRSYLLKYVDWGVFVLLLILILSGGSTFSQNQPDKNQYKFMHLSINDGLSNNQVRAILKDRQGFMWFGTGRGLNRFDGVNFKRYKYDAYDGLSLPFNMIDFLFEDTQGNIWIKSLESFIIFNSRTESFLQPADYLSDTSIPVESLRTLFSDHQGNTWFVNSGYGLFKLNPADRSVTAVPSEHPGVVGSHSLVDIAQDSENNLWVISYAGVLEKLDYESLQVIGRFTFNEEHAGELSNYKLFVDSDDDVWVYAPGRPYGAFMLDNSTGEILHGNTESTQLKLNNNLVSSVVQDARGRIWLGTDHGGINQVNKSDLSLTYLVNNPDDNYSLSQNSVNTLYRDSEDLIWAGTYKKGISYYHENLIRFEHFKHIPSVPSSLPFNDVNCFVEDRRGNLWIGTNGGGLLYFDRQKNSYQEFKYDPSDPYSLSNNIIVSLYIDRSNQLWIGTYYGGLNRFDGRQFYRYQHDPDDPTSLSDNRVWEIYEDSQRNLWVGTLTGGLELFDRDKEIFYHYLPEDMNSVRSDFIISIIEDSENILWLGTADGIDRLNLQTKRFEHFAAEPGVPGKLSDKNALQIHEDARGYIWVATPEGLNLYRKAENRFRVFTENDGLADANIKTILEDQQGHLWVATTNGLSRVEILNYSESSALEELQIQVTNFDARDGLQGKEFNENAAYRTRAGELIFGGPNGFNLFTPERLAELKPSNKIVLTNLKVFNQEVPVGLPFRERVILDQSITRQEKITLRYNENVFSLSFAALNYFQPGKNSFQYRLEGFNDEWLKADVKNTEAGFTNLNAGEYLFRVRVSDDGGGSWREMNPPLRVVITPPFWRSYYAYTAYVLLIILLLYFARRILVERERLKFQAEQDHQEAERVQQLDALKTRFFTNISHEFRTPLSLILAPIEKMILKTTDDKQKEQLKFIHRHARRLLAMVNQLLDFRKMEVQKMEARKSWGNLVGFIREVGFSFYDLAENKGIKFDFQADPSELYTFFDHDKTEKILSNLLSNAYKFTPENGEVSLTVKLEQLEQQDTGESMGRIHIVVRDSGIGIPQEKQQRIFDRFFQEDLPSSFVNQGSGIGLSLVAEYVAILGGTIRVDSSPEQGSSFWVALPVPLLSDQEIEQNKQGQGSQQVISYFSEPAAMTKRQPSTYDAAKKTILLVEDNDDFRFYLKDNLKGSYNIVEAGNGKMGWELALKTKPDLIVSDVMMPEMDGLEFCAKIKKDSRTLQIPVILLTAKTDVEPTVEGFESGADDYISKPFNFRILESRIENLISSRDQLRMSTQAMVGIQPGKIEVDSPDGKFLNKALAIVEKNIENSKFSVEDLSKSVGLSRVSLYKKLMHLTHRSPIEFIRLIRLRRAVDLIENSQLTVSEIAYQCGFNSPRYFSKYFKAEYKMLPSEYIVKHRKEPKNFRSDF